MSRSSLRICCRSLSSASASPSPLSPSLPYDSIVKFVGFSLEPMLLICMEFANGGTLSDWLQTHDPLNPPPFLSLIKILVGSAKAFEYLHMIEPMPVLHRDIKSESRFDHCAAPFVLPSFLHQRLMRPQDILLTEAHEARVADLVSLEQRQSECTAKLNSKLTQLLVDARLDREKHECTPRERR